MLWTIFDGDVERPDETPAFPGEQKYDLATVDFHRSSDREGRRGPTWVPAFLAEQQRAR